MVLAPLAVEVTVYKLRHAPTPPASGVHGTVAPPQPEQSSEAVTRHGNQMLTHDEDVIGDLEARLVHVVAGRAAHHDPLRHRVYFSAGGLKEGPLQGAAAGSGSVLVAMQQQHTWLKLPDRRGASPFGTA